MEPNARTMETRYNLTALNGDEVTMFKSLQFTDEIHRLISTPPTDNASSFTALLELPSPQAVELLYSPESSNLIPTSPLNFEDFKDNFHFPSNTCLIERDTRFSAEVNNNNESEKSKSPESKNLSTNLEKAIKSEQAETESSQPLASDPTLDKQNIKRNDGENKVKGSTKKNKTAVNESSENAQKLPYVHVRARRGKATDSHSHNFFYINMNIYYGVYIVVDSGYCEGSAGVADDEPKPPALRLRVERRWGYDSFSLLLNHSKSVGSSGSCLGTARKENVRKPQGRKPSLVRQTKDIPSTASCAGEKANDNCLVQKNQYYINCMEKIVIDGVFCL
ncbi:transcription factor bHLH60-like [Hibiscus syriacus]|uniref:transcription factor bHLH60-like n=1 Tax=Hibiscus syriacus TaxID=106335 RepID=UPI00192490B7|nr:transcription factor bHLH60-like [Hibiscus syriacus]